jgi:hypothetical protein
MQTTNRQGHFTAEENAILTEYLDRYCIDRLRLASVSHDFNLRVHRLNRCSWWRRGEGTLVHATPDFSPARILADRER